MIHDDCYVWSHFILTRISALFSIYESVFVVGHVVINGAVTLFIMVLCFRVLLVKMVKKDQLAHQALL